MAETPTAAPTSAPTAAPIDGPSASELLEISREFQLNNPDSDYHNVLNECLREAKSGNTENESRYRLDLLVASMLRDKGYSVTCYHKHEEGSAECAHDGKCNGCNFTVVRWSFAY